MPDSGPVPVNIEEARIQAAYAKRQKVDARYLWFSPDHLFMIQERNGGCYSHSH